MSTKQTDRQKETSNGQFDMTPDDRPASHGPGLATNLLLAWGVGGAGGLCVASSLFTWYRRLRKPAFTPPDPVFGLVWSALYTAMAVAASRVGRRPASVARVQALSLYGLQLGLNFSWTWLFFGRRDPKAALAGHLLLSAAQAATVERFARVDRPAAALLAPSLAWSAVSLALNAAVVRLNPGLRPTAGR